MSASLVLLVSWLVVLALFFVFTITTVVREGLHRDDAKRILSSEVRHDATERNRR